MILVHHFILSTNKIFVVSYEQGYQSTYLATNNSKVLLFLPTVQSLSIETLQFQTPDFVIPMFFAKTARMKICIKRSHSSSDIFSSSYIWGFTKFGIKVLWRLQFLKYLRTFRKLGPKLKLSWLYPVGCISLADTLIPWSLKKSWITECL